MKGKKLIALVLCLLMTVSLLPVSALAEGDGEEPAQPVDTTPPTAETDPGEAPQGDAKNNDTTPPADDGDGDVLTSTASSNWKEKLTNMMGQDDVLYTR